LDKGGYKKMKIVISATGRDTDSDLDETFHRCSFYLIIDTETNSCKTLENTIRDHPSEIGAMTGQIVANEGIDAVITADIGPRAFEIFERYGIKMYRAKGNIDDAIRQFSKGKLSEITKPTMLQYADSEQ
jgi:predicted Fe-Mo cluster-binding NifX family protein